MLSTLILKIFGNNKRAVTLFLLLSSMSAFSSVAQTEQVIVHSAPSVKTEQVIVHSKPSIKTEARLPCNQGENKFCNLRIYQVMVESFVNGDPNRSFNAGYGPSQHKGDLQGIINSLDYIRSLNVNAIWLTPIFDTGSEGDTGDALRLGGTGYFAHDYFKIDPHFGTLEQAQELVKKAHEKGMYVFLDGVFGHAKKDGVVASPKGLKPVLEKCVDLPANYPGLCAKYPESRDFYTEVAMYWVNKIGIDGWRLDQAYQLPVADWHFIQNKVLEEAQARNTIGYMVGELWKDNGEANYAPTVQKYGFGTAENPGLMSAFDFPVRVALLSVLATQEDETAKHASHQPASWLNGEYAMGSHRLYPDFAIPNLMIGNHDLVRFGNLLSRAKVANPSDNEYWQSHRLAFAFLTAYSGPITIYYGDEIGDFIPNFSQKVTHDCISKNLCDDHVSRTDAKILGVTVKPEDLDPRAIKLKDYVSKLMLLKSEHPALYSGSRTHLASGEDYYVDLKAQGSDRILFIMNLSKNEKVFEFDRSLLGNQTMFLQDLLTDEKQKVQSAKVIVKVPPMDAKFIGLKP